MLWKGAPGNSSQGHSNSSTTWEETKGGKRGGEQLSQLCEPERT